MKTTNLLIAGQSKNNKDIDHQRFINNYFDSIFDGKVKNIKENAVIHYKLHEVVEEFMQRLRADSISEIESDNNEGCLNCLELQDEVRRLKFENGELKKSNNILKQQIVALKASLIGAQSDESLKEEVSK